MSLNVGKILGIQTQGIINHSSNITPLNIKKSFEFGNASPVRPEHRSNFTEAELCGAPVCGKNLYLLG